MGPNKFPSKDWTGVCRTRVGHPAMTDWRSPNSDRGYNDGLSVVWTVPSSGGRTLVMLSTDDAQSVSMPGSCWSTPDDLVSYTADPVGPDQIYVVASEGGNRRRVTEPPQVAWEPTFSPDGEWLVFESHKNGRKGEIWKVRSDGSQLTRLTSGSNDRQPNWSPKGDLIVFQRHRRHQVDVWLMDTNGEDLRNVTRTRSREETDVSFSPSGDYLVFSGDGKDVDFASLFTIALDGTGRDRLTHAADTYDGAPGWSRDGTRIAFESYRGDPDGSPGTRIWVIDAPPDRR